MNSKCFHQISVSDPFHFDTDPFLGKTDPDADTDPVPTLYRKIPTFFL